MIDKHVISQEVYAKIQDTFRVLQMNLNALHAIIENSYTPRLAIRPDKEKLTEVDRKDDG